MSANSLQSLYAPRVESHHPASLKYIQAENVMVNPNPKLSYTELIQRQANQGQYPGSLILDGESDEQQAVKRPSDLSTDTKLMEKPRDAKIRRIIAHAQAETRSELDSSQNGDANYVYPNNNKATTPIIEQKESEASPSKVSKDVRLPVNQVPGKSPSKAQDVDALRKQLLGFHAFKAFIIINLICGVLTVIAGVFSIVYFVILQMNIQQLGIRNYQFDFLKEFVVIAVHWVLHFLAAIIGLVAIMNRSFCALKTFIVFHVLNICCLLAGSGLLVNYRIRNYHGSFTYLDIVLYTELGLLIILVAQTFPVFSLHRALKRSKRFACVGIRV